MYGQGRSSEGLDLYKNYAAHANGHRTAKAMLVTIIDISSSQWTANDLAQSDMAEPYAPSEECIVDEDRT